MVVAGCGDYFHFRQHSEADEELFRQWADLPCDRAGPASAGLVQRSRAVAGMPAGRGSHADARSGAILAFENDGRSVDETGRLTSRRPRREDLEPIRGVSELRRMTSASWPVMSVNGRAAWIPGTAWIFRLQMSFPEARRSEGQSPDVFSGFERI